MSQLSDLRIGKSFPQFLDQLETIETKVRLSAELMDIVNEGGLANIDGVCLMMAEASDSLSSIVDNLKTMHDKLLQEARIGGSWVITLCPARSDDAPAASDLEVAHA